jgi:crotonobetainyl-CoA:carnitine CoA-transferase CaiB-like acyl-CoA transferase
VRGPSLDAAQTGYGPGYWIYECGDGQWLALVVSAEEAWQALGGLVPDLAREYAPLRGGTLDAVAAAAEGVLEAAFATAAAADWLQRLQAAGLLGELIEPLDRDGFRRMILDDPVNRQLGRVASYDTADWGWFEQIGPLVRTGPEPGVSTRPMLPGVGEHTIAVLAELGLTPAEIQDLLDAKVARQLAC